VTAGVVAGVAGALAAVNRRWHRVSGAMIAALDPARASTQPFTERDLEGLPEPVGRYLRRSLRVGEIPPRFALIRHEGEFRMGDAWRPFTSVEAFAVSPAGFVWDARIRMVPLVSVHVRDSFLQGAGSMQAAVAALVPLVNQRGGPDLNAGALQRYLAEATWLPASLLPRHGVAWESIDPLRARATLSEGGTCVSLEFTFDGQGEVTEVYAPARMREVDGRFEPTAWSARLWNCQDRCGTCIPLEAEVAWHVAGTPQPYWRGRIMSIECR
jgi:hypothetical protein